MDFRQQFWVELDVRKVVLARGNLCEAAVEGSEKSRKIEPQVLRGVGEQVVSSGGVQFAGSADVAISKMVEGHRCLDEPLVELSRRPPVVCPEFFPELMALVVVTRVEGDDALQVERVVGLGRCFGHGVSSAQKRTTLGSRQVLPAKGFLVVV
jgi:hypothetical protein